MEAENDAEHLQREPENAGQTESGQGSPDRHVALIVRRHVRGADGELIGTIRRHGSRVAVALDELAGGETPEEWAAYLRTHPAALRGDRKVFAPLEGRSRDRSRLGAQASGHTGPPPRRDHLK